MALAGILGSTGLLHTVSGIRVQLLSHLSAKEAGECLLVVLSERKRDKICGKLAMSSAVTAHLRKSLSLYLSFLPY